MRCLLCLFLSLATACTAIAQTPTTNAAMVQSRESLHPSFAVEDARQIIPQLAAMLEANYVFPEVGRRYAAMLRTNLAAGRYSSFADAGEFALRVSADLQAVARDGHLVLIAPRTDRPAPSAAHPPADAPPPIGRSGWLAPGVAYVEFHSFPSSDANLARLREFVAGHAHARTLIIDLVNEHSGGWIGEADVLFGQLYRAPADLVAIDVRKSVDERMGGLPTGATIRRADSPEGIARYVHSVTPAPDAVLGNTQVFVLIGPRTISAGEHLAFALQRSGRATLIGEATHGAGNVETEFPLAAGYSAVIPFGRAFDPRTNAGWESVGVRPDIPVAADHALDEALRRAGVRLSAQEALARLN